MMRKHLTKYLTFLLSKIWTCVVHGALYSALKLIYSHSYCGVCLNGCSTSKFTTAMGDRDPMNYTLFSAFIKLHVLWY